MVNMELLTKSVADYILKKMSKHVDMSREFREELTEKAIAQARDKAGFCKGTTNAGALCSRGAKDNAGYCFQHAYMEVEVPAKKEKKQKKQKKQKKEKRRKHRHAVEEEFAEESTAVEETVEEDLEEKKLVFPTARDEAFLPGGDITRAKVFPRPKYQKRYFALFNLWRQIRDHLGRVYFKTVIMHGEENVLEKLSQEEKDEAHDVIDTLRYRAEAMLDEMEETGKCHSSNVRELTKSIEKKWNIVFGEILEEIDTSLWKRYSDKFDTN
jgi:hypothetical protein